MQVSGGASRSEACGSVGTHCPSGYGRAGTRTLPGHRGPGRDRSEVSVGIGRLPITAAAQQPVLVLHGGAPWGATRPPLQERGLGDRGGAEEGDSGCSGSGTPWTVTSHTFLAHALLVPLLPATETPAEGLALRPAPALGTDAARRGAERWPSPAPTPAPTSDTHGGRVTRTGAHEHP